MSSLCSSSSSSSCSSENSISYNSRVQKSIDAESLISWNSIEARLDKFQEVLQQLSSNERLFILKSRCLSNNCGCVLKNHDWFFARVFVDCKLLVAKWSKLKFSKSTIPDTEQIAKFILFKQYGDWIEIMNENLEVIPFWINSSQIIQNKPKAFLLRKDTKCLILKDILEDDSYAFDFFILKSATILSFVSSKRYNMRKGRNKVKEQCLIKCKDEQNMNYYFMPDDSIFASPIAGPENISGCHTMDNVIDKFHFPINVKSVFQNPPLPSLTCSDRNFLNLSERFQLNLIFLSPYNESKRLFVITPGLFDDHLFTIGEILSPSILNCAYPDYFRVQLDQFQLKVNEFFIKCHRYDCLSYLLKYALNTSRITPKFESNNNEFDDIYIEVEDIYFYIRNGYFPRKSAKLKSKMPSFRENIDTKNTSSSLIKTPIPITEDSVNNSSKLEMKLSKINELGKENAENEYKYDINNEIEENEGENDEDDDDDMSSSISTTSSETDITSSTALEISKGHHTKQAKSMPLTKSKQVIKSASFNTSHYNIDLTCGDMLNLKIMNVCIPEDNEKAVDIEEEMSGCSGEIENVGDEDETVDETGEDQDEDENEIISALNSDKDVKRKVLKFYHSDDEKSMKVLNLENISLKDTAV